jgi:hypothetical protein
VLSSHSVVGRCGHLHREDGWVTTGRPAHAPAHAEDTR